MRIHVIVVVLSCILLIFIKINSWSPQYCEEQCDNIVKTVIDAKILYVSSVQLILSQHNYSNKALDIHWCSDNTKLLDFNLVSQWRLLVITHNVMQNICNTLQRNIQLYAILQKHSSVLLYYESVKLAQ